MASLIRTIQTRLSVSLLFLLQAQLNFLHLDNNAEDNDMTAQTPPEQHQRSPPKSKFFYDSFIIIFFDGCNSMILSHTTMKFISTCAVITTQCAFTIVISTVSLQNDHSYRTTFYVSHLKINHLSCTCVCHYHVHVRTCQPAIN